MAELPVSYVSVTPREVFAFFETAEHLRLAQESNEDAVVIQTAAHPHVLCIADVGITAYEALELLSLHFRPAMHPKTAGRLEEDDIWGFSLPRSIEGGWKAPDIAGWDLDSWGDWDKLPHTEIPY